MIRKNILKLFLFVIAGLTSISLVASCESGETTLESEDDDAFTMESRFRYDEDNHWKIDSNGHIKNKGKHKFDNETHLCKTCGVSNGEGDFDWEYASNGTIVITKYYGNATDLIVSSLSYNKNKLTISGIAEYAFDSNTSLESICLASSVTMLGDYAFQYCNNLTNVMLRLQTLSIGAVPFFYCENLAAVNCLNESVNDLLKISYYGELFSLFVCSPSLYCDWELVTNLVIPESTTSIPAYCFCGYGSIESVTIPLSVKEICDMAFYLCPNLTNVYYEGSLNDWLKITLGEYYKGSYINAYWANPCINGANLYLKENLLTELEIDDTFNGGTVPAGIFGGVNLQKVTISSSIGSVGDGTFYNAHINNVYYEGNLDSWVSFQSTNSVCGWIVDNFYVDNNLISGDYTISSTITSLNTYAFSGLLGLNSVFIPNSVNTIETYCFYRCTNLQSAVFESGLSLTNEKISDYCFEGCTSLKSIVLPKVREIGYGAFDECANLDTIYYCGTTMSQFNNISIPSHSINNADINIPGTTMYIFSKATLYLYSENQPTESGNYWHWVQNAPTSW